MLLKNNQGKFYGKICAFDLLISLQAGKQGQLKVQRFQSTSSGSEKYVFSSLQGTLTQPVLYRSNVGLLIGGVTVLGVAGATAYAKYDSGFRRTIEENIPYADKALDVVIGSKEPLAPPSTPVKVPMTRKVEQESLLKKKLEREKQEIKTEPQLAKQTASVDSKSDATLISIPKPEPPKTSIGGSIASQLGKGNLLPDSTSKGDKSTTTEPSTNEEGGLNPGSSISPRKIVPKDGSSKTRENVRKDPREELREQLKIQLSAYSDYLREQLHLQENELKRMHSIALEERILEEKMRYQRELATSIERLREVERILQGEFECLINVTKQLLALF